MRWLELLCIGGIVSLLASCMNNTATNNVSEDFDIFVRIYNESNKTIRHVQQLGESFIVDDFEILLYDEVRFLDSVDRFDVLDIFPWIEEEILGGSDALNSIFESEIAAHDRIFYIPVTITNLQDEPRTGELNWLPLTTLYYHEAFTNDSSIVGEGVACEFLDEFHRNRNQLTSRQLVELNILMVRGGRGLTAGRVFPDSVYNLPRRTIEANSSIDVMIYISYTESGYHALRFFIPHPPEDELPATFYDFIFKVEE